MTEVTDLVRRARQGDADAFAAVIEAYKQDLYKVARSYLHSDADAADAMGDTVLLLYSGEGFSVREIGTILDLKQETVKTRLKRGRACFRAAYEGG